MNIYAPETRMYRATLTLAAALSLTACLHGGDGDDTSGGTPLLQTQTTTYCHGDFNRILVHDTNGLETYEVVLRPLGPDPITATGTRNGDQLLLQATDGNVVLDYDMTIVQGGDAITGTIDAAVGPMNFLLTEFGATGECPTENYPAEPLQQVVQSDFTDPVNDIQDISLFRSAAGHDYSDDFESCRSMKHYFSPPLAKRTNGTVPVFAPFAGTIVSQQTSEENFVDDGVTNQQVVIRSTSNPAILAVLFHVDLSSTAYAAGTEVTAGEQLGHARMQRNGGTAHDFDIAIHVNTDQGVRYVSYFDAMTDTVFGNYATFGSARSDFIITEAERDADPLTCDGETFTSTGSTPSWIFNLP